jgi:hypothetical protein
MSKRFRRNRKSARRSGWPFERRIALALSLAVLLACSATSLSTREVPLKNWWELDFKISQPQVRFFKDYDGTFRNFVLFTYTVTNKTKQDIRFYPDFLIETDVNTQHWDTVFIKLEEQVEAEEGRTILNSAQVIGVIKPGETKRGLAVFRGVDDRADWLHIYCFGFTNAYKFDERDEDKILYRVWRMDYHRPGDEIDRRYDRLIFSESAWDYHALR